MGRAFEYRKARKFKRWGNMARTFTRLGKEITIAAKNGSDPATNPRLRAIIQTAKSENMPKDNIERAIKRATEKDQKDYKEIVYEGYGPHGIGILIETATDNHQRTVANLRSYFTKAGCSLGVTGCLSFMFEHKCVFNIKPKEGVDMEELELELIDCGIDEIFMDDETGNITIYAPFEAYGDIQKYIESNGFELVSARFDYRHQGIERGRTGRRAEAHRQNRRRRRCAECVHQHEIDFCDNEPSVSLRISAKPVMCKRTLPPWPAVRSFAYGSFWQNLRPCRKKTSFAPRIFPGRTRRQPMADDPMDWQNPGKAGSAHGLHCHLHGFPKEDRQRPDMKNANKARSSLR